MKLMSKWLWIILTVVLAGYGTPQARALVNETRVITIPTNAVSFSASSFTVLATETEATITLKRSGDLSTTASVVFATSNGTATNGVDYVSTTETVAFAVDESQVDVTIPLLTDSTLDMDRTVNLRISSPSDGIGLTSPSSAVLTIQSLQLPTLQFATTEFRVLRNAGHAVVTVFRLGDTSGEATVDYATSDDTAVSSVDYYGTSGTLFFSPGDTQKSFSFPISDSGLFESNKMLFVTLSNETGADLAGDSTAIVKIVNYLPQTISWQDYDGDLVTATLQKAGTMNATDTGWGRLIQLDAPNTNSTLSIKVKKAPEGDGLVDIDGIEADGDCKSVSARSANLVGEVIFTGYVGQLQVHDISNGITISAGGNATQQTKIQACDIPDGAEIELGSRLASFQAFEFPFGDLTAPSVGNISIRGDKRNQIPGDFSAWITLTGEGVASNQLALGSLSVAGSISETIIDVAYGNVGSVRAASMVDSAIYLGFTPTDPTNPMVGGDFEPGLKINSINITGTTDAFSNSFIMAARVGSVRLGSVVINNGGLQFGVLADESIGSAAVKAPVFKWQPTGISDQSLGDLHFHVK